MSAPLRAQVDARGVAHTWNIPRTPGRLLAYRAPGTLTAQATVAAERLGLRSLGTDPSGWTILEGDDATLRDAAHALVTSGAAQYVQPEYTYQPAALPTPNDSGYSAQSGYMNQVNLPAAWAKVSPGCKPIIVAVVDSGIDESDPELLPNLTPPSSWATFKDAGATQGAASIDLRNPDKNAAWHGQAVAAVIAQVSGNGSGASGATYNLAKVLPLNALQTNGSPMYVFSSTGIGNAIQYANGQVTLADGRTLVNPYPAQVVNLSLSDTGSTWLGDDQYMKSYVQWGLNRGMVIVAAAGNSNNPMVGSPAQNTYMLAVGSVGQGGTKSTFSNYGRGLDFAAPGEHIWGRSNGSSNSWTGTSMAAPMFASQIALWMYANQQYAGTPNAGRTGEAFWDHLMTCLGSVASNHPTWNAGTKSWSGGWTDQTGGGWLDTARLVDKDNANCR